MPRVHGHTYRRARGAAPAVADGVAEGDDSGGCRRKRDLQFLVATHHVNASDRWIDRVERRDRQHVAVGRVIVEEDRENSRLAGTGAEVVIDRNRGPLHRIDGGRHILSVLLCLLVGVLRDQRSPVVDQFAGGLHGPGTAAPNVIEHKMLHVARKTQLGAAWHRCQGETGSGCRIPRALSPGGPGGPCRVLAAVPDRRRSGRAREPAEDGCRCRPVDGDAVKRGPGRQQHAGRRVAWQLELGGDASRQQTCDVGDVAVDRELAGRGIQNGPLVAHRGDLDRVGGSPQVHGPALIHLICGARVESVDLAELG